MVHGAFGFILDLAGRPRQDTLCHMSESAAIVKLFFLLVIACVQFT